MVLTFAEGIKRVEKVKLIFPALFRAWGREGDPA
jgi:hypothetical protein